MSRISTGIHGVDRQLLTNYQRNNDRTQTSLERLSTGKRINHPKDDPSGFVAAEGLRQDLADLKQKLKGIATDRAESHIQQSGLADIKNALTELRGRLDSTTDGLLTADQRATLEDEIDTTVDAINRIAKLTDNTGSASLNTNGASLASDPNAAQLVDDKSQAVTNQQVALAVNERANLDTFQNLYQDQIVITSEALSQIEDTDFAAESANLVQSQVMSQSSMAALAYSSRQLADQIKSLLNTLA
jgi:flagellin